MLIRNFTMIVLMFLLSITAQAQAIDNTLSFKNISNNAYVRLNFDNDWFASSDCYYTGGMHAEWVAPWIKRFPLSRLLIHPKYSYMRFGLGLESDIYTPINIRNGEILRYDRPYAGVLLLKTFLIAIDSANKQRFSSTLSTGVIGPASGAMYIQTDVHRVLPNNTVPEGWPNQVHNDAVLNYEASYAKQLVAAEPIFLLDASGMARVGTLNDKAGIGPTAMLGYFNSPFKNIIVTKKKFRAYAYDHAEVDVIGYDATLEGGVFNRTSPYTISANDVRRLTFQNRYGMVFTFDRMYLEYFRTFLTSEFDTGRSHSWGGIELAVGF